jgi:hypothetical protein
MTTKSSNDYVLSISGFASSAARRQGQMLDGHLALPHPVNILLNLADGCRDFSRKSRYLVICRVMRLNQALSGR